MGLTRAGVKPRSTLTSGTGLKTRHFGTIISELTSCIHIHTTYGSRLGGVSLEFTGELNDEGFSVTECLGGSMELSEEELGLRYQVRRFVTFYFVQCSAFGTIDLTPNVPDQSFCDPRLNFEQSLGKSRIRINLGPSPVHSSALTSLQTSPSWCPTTSRKHVVEQQGKTISIPHSEGRNSTHLVWKTEDLSEDAEQRTLFLHCYTCLFVCVRLVLVETCQEKKRKRERGTLYPENGTPCDASSIIMKDRNPHPMKLPGATFLGVLSHSGTSGAGQKSTWLEQRSQERGAS